MQGNELTLLKRWYKTHLKLKRQIKKVVQKPFETSKTNKVKSISQLLALFVFARY